MGPGADAKGEAVRRMLGHVFADLVDADVDTVPDRLDEASERSVVGDSGPTPV
jgi:hypothetical protein